MARRSRSNIFIVIGTFVAAVWGIYCAWLVVEAWWFARFLLSSGPFIMLGVGAVALAVYRAGSRYVRPLAVASVVALGVFQFDFALKQGTFNARDGRRRFVAVSRLVGRVTPENSAVISLDYSGSIRYYGGRMTMNYASIVAETPIDYFDGMFEGVEHRDADIRSLRLLLELVRTHVETTGQVELYPVWYDEWNAQPRGTIDVHLGGIDPDTFFFHERFVHHVTK